MVKIVDLFEDVLQTKGMKKYFAANRNKRKRVSKRKQKVPMSIVTQRKGKTIGDDFGRKSDTL